MTKINVAELDFTEIKDNIRDFLTAQSELSDYNFESSALSVLLDILAYNTSLNSFYLDMATNESFLDSSILRQNVVAHAKALGYTPRSKQASTATLSCIFTVTGSPDTITIPKDTAFSTTITGTTYTFYTRESYTVTRDPAATNPYTEDIEIFEGKLFTHKYTHSASTPDRFLIPNASADTDHLIVTVQNSAIDSVTTTFTEVQNINEVDSTSTVFFLSEVEDGLYEVKFGDGVVGKALVDGNIVILDYLVTNGSTANSATTFSLQSSITDVTSIAITTDGSDAGGDSETIESIKYYAPLFYESRYRAVTKNDYEALIINSYANAESIRVWGGEENDPPVYGKVFVAIKPKSGLTLTETAKQNIITSIIEPISLVPIEVEIKDPDYLFLDITSTVQYDSTLSSLTAGQLKANIMTAMSSFTSSDLNQFSKNFYYTQFTKAIDDVSAAITSNETDVKIKYRFEPTLNTSKQYELPINNELDTGDVTNAEYCLSSTSFTYQGYTSYLTDDGQGVVSIFRLASGLRVNVVDTAGTIDYSTGKITLTSFAPSSITSGDDYIEITTIPKTKNIDSVRNQIITIEDANISITMEQV